MVARGVVLFNNGFILLVLRFRLEERGVFIVELRDAPPLPTELIVPLYTVAGQLFGAFGSSSTGAPSKLLMIHNSRLLQFIPLSEFKVSLKFKALLKFQALSKFEAC